MRWVMNNDIPIWIQPSKMEYLPWIWFQVEVFLYTESSKRNSNKTLSPIVEFAFLDFRHRRSHPRSTDHQCCNYLPSTSCNQAKIEVSSGYNLTGKNKSDVYLVRAVGSEFIARWHRLVFHIQWRCRYLTKINRRIIDLFWQNHCLIVYDRFVKSL